MSHIFFRFERKRAVTRRYRRLNDLDEAMAQEFTAAYLAVRSHVNEEQRLNHL